MEGPFEKGIPEQGDQSPRVPRERYRIGLAALNRHTQSTLQKPFKALTAEQQDRILHELEDGKIAFEGYDSASFFALVLINAMEGFFADPVYGGNRDMVSWKMLGFPGARYDYRDYIGRHNEDLKLQPVHQEVETNQLPFPFNVRTSLIVWNWMNVDKGEFKPDMSKSAGWNRGAYLVQGLGHCGTCHTPKNVLGGDKSSQFLSGAVVEGWWAPNLTSNEHDGLGKWTQDDIVSYLRTGVNRYDMASGPMADAVKNSTQYWRADDLNAVAIYLKSTPAQGSDKPAPLAAGDSRMKTGALIYAAKCSACHAPQGKGGQNIFPRLADSPLINAPEATSLIHVVVAGSRGVDTDTRPNAPAMPSFAGTLSDEEMADVITYIRNSWGNAASPVSASDVQKLKAELRE